MTRKSVYLVTVFVILVGFVGCSKPTSDVDVIRRAVQATLTAQPAQTLASAARSVPATVLLPTATEKPATATRLPSTATPTAMPTAAPTATPAPTYTPTRSPTATPTSGPSVVSSTVVNLRAGPGTNYPMVGTTAQGGTYAIQSRNGDGTWLEICCVDKHTAWVAASVVKTTGGMGGVQIAKNIPTPPPSPTPAPVPTAAPPAQVNTAAFPQIGQEVETGGWRFKVLETHKRKAVYLYNTPYIAQGHFLVVIIEAVNQQPGTAYFRKDVAPYVEDVPGKGYSSSSKGSSYAAWQYSKDSEYDDVNPGVVSRMAIAFDLPDNLGDVLLSAGPFLNPKWIYLGNFAQMKSEDS